MFSWMFDNFHIKMFLNKAWQHTLTVRAQETEAGGSEVAASLGTEGKRASCQLCSCLCRQTDQNQRLSCSLWQEQKRCPRRQLSCPLLWGQCSLTKGEHEGKEEGVATAFVHLMSVPGTWEDFRENTGQRPVVWFTVHSIKCPVPPACSGRNPS